MKVTKATTIKRIAVYGLFALGGVAVLSGLSTVQPPHAAAAGIGGCSQDGYFPRFTNLVKNGSFSTAPSDVAPAGSNGRNNTSPGHYYANAGFRSQMANAGYNVYPRDSNAAGTDVFNIFSVQKGPFNGAESKHGDLRERGGAVLNQIPFPGHMVVAGNRDSEVPKVDTWLYTNGNAMPHNKMRNIEYLTWEQDVSGLTVGKEYVFVAYISNVIEPPNDSRDDPTIRFRVGGTTGMPDGTVIGGPTVLTEANTGNKLPIGGWQRVAFPFKATSGTQKFKVTDASPGWFGDDFALTAIHISECVPMYDYELTTTPKVNGPDLYPGQTEITGGDRPTSKVVHKEGPSDSKTPVNYGMSQFVVRKDQPFNKITTEGTKDDWSTLPSNWSSCAFPNLLTNTTECKMVSEVRNSTDPVKRGSSIDMKIPDTIDLPNDLNFGDQVCWMSFVSTYDEGKDPHQFRYSPPVCLTVSKTPQVQFQGADIRSGGNVATQYRTIGGRVFGSWAEYAIFSGKVVGGRTSSGAGLSADSTGRMPYAAPLDYNKLTFSNTDPNNMGNYDATIPSSVVPGQFLTNDGATVENLSGGSVDVRYLIRNTTPGTYVYVKGSGDLTIANNDNVKIPKGVTVIVRVPNGTVMLNGNIDYAPGPHSNLSELPQFVIYAKNIAIDANVANIDAWLIANNSTDSYISTCGRVNPANWLDGVSANTCNSKLSINGPVITSHLYLRRTHGAQQGSQNIPAEVFNLRPDTYLWSYNYASNAGSIRTTYIKELPPRW